MFFSPANSMKSKSILPWGFPEVTLPRSTSGFTSGFLETHRLGTGWQVNIESRLVPKKCVLKFKVWKLNKDSKYDGLEKGVSFQLPRFWVSFLGVLLIE